MGKIVLLDDLTINQIAAGEVIERPASAIKEMVENSIDAGAKNITVEIEDGGIALIRITDDGTGIAEDDMDIAFERHATSKIRKAQDIEMIETMGFRGEALASIAAISKVEMVSKTAVEEVGHKIIIEGGKVVEKSEIASAQGTRITVQNLFFNTPVRYKFLKKYYTEAGYVETAVTRIALANRNVAIKLISNNKVLLQTNGNGELKDVLYSIYGKDVAEGIINIDYTYQDMRVTGVIGKPEIARSNRSNQMFFVNNRFIKDGKLSAAVEQAYSGLLPYGKYAFAVLNLEVDPKKVDINVHPAKLEVRFSEDAEVFRAVYNAAKAGVSELMTPPEVKLTKEKIENEEIEAKEAVIKEDKIEEAEEDVEDRKEKTQKSGLSNLIKKFVKDNEEETEEEQNEEEEESIYPKLEIKDDEPKVDETKEILEDQKEEFKIEIKPPEGFKEEPVQPIEEFKIEIKPPEGFKEEPVEAIVNEVVEEIKPVGNEDIIDKEIKIGDTKISSNTKTLDFNISEAVKEETRAIDTTRKIKIDETQAIPVTKPVVAQETQTVDINSELKSETKIEEKEVVEDTSEKDETAPVENINEVATEVSEKEETVQENKEPSIEDVEKITSQIVELKINNPENTQMIDTVSVREAIKEANEVTPEFADMYKKTFGVDANVIRKEREIEEKEKEKINVSNEFVNAENSTIFENEEVVTPRVNYKLIGTAFNTNIIIELNNEMYIIDHNSALFRLAYETVKEIYYAEGNKDSQTLLLPDIITVSFREMSLARENIELFLKAGFDFEEFGENTIRLTAVPTFCEDLNTKQLFINVLNEIDRVLLNEKEEKEEMFITAVAKFATVKIKRPLELREIDELLQKLLVLDNPFEVIDGNVVAIKMSRADIEKKFSRRK